MLTSRVLGRFLVLVLAALTVLTAVAPPALARSAATTRGVEPTPARGDGRAGRRERADMRTESSRTFENPDGSFTSELYPGVIHYRRDDSASWEPVDLRFRAAADGASAVSNRAPVSVTLAAPASRGGFLRMSDGRHQVSFSLPPGVASPNARGKPAISEGRAEIADFLPGGVSLRVFPRARGAKSFLVLSQRPTTSEFAFLLRAPGLTVTATDEGSVALTDAEGAVVAEIPRPFAVDSRSDDFFGSGAYSEPVSIAISQHGEDHLLTLTVDPLYLDSATYPVYIDPTSEFHTGVTNAYGDAFVSSQYPNTNYGDYQRPDSPFYHEHWLGTKPGADPYVQHVYMKFNVSDLEGAIVDSATLEVYPYHQYYNAPTATRTWVRKVTGDWNESTLTWNNKPGYNAVGYADLVEGEIGQFDVAATVQEWLNAPSQNFGFRLDANGNDATHWKRLVASEQGDPVYTPQLKVQWHRVHTPSGPAGWTNGRTVSWTYAGASPQVAFRVQVATDNDFTATSKIHDSTDQLGVATSYVLPAGVSLTNGSLYFWRVKVQQGTSWSAWANSSFVYEASAPSGTLSINGGAGSTDTSTVELGLNATDPNATSSYSGDGRTVDAAITGGCPSAVCVGTWNQPALGADRAEGAIAAVANSTTQSGSHTTWVDAVAGGKASFAADLRRDTRNPIIVGLISTDDSQVDLRLVDDGTGVTRVYYTPTNEVQSYTGQTISPALPFEPGVWYRMLITSNGWTRSLWWWPRDEPRPAQPTLLVEGAYLPNARLYVTHFGSQASPTTVWLDNIEVADGGSAAPYGSSITEMRFSNNGSTWGAWQPYGTSATYTLPAGAGSRTVYAQFRDAAGNVSPTVSDTITVSFGNLGRQRQHSFESWDIGAGDELSVNVANGNFVLTHPLVELPIRGSALPVSLTYNSQDSTNVGVGPGVRLNLQRRLVVNADGTVTFVDGDGARHKFTTPSTVGTVTSYTRPPAFYGALVRDASATPDFTLTYKDQSRDRFTTNGSQGLLVRTEDRHANGVTLAYGGGTNVASVTDDVGRQLLFSWDTSVTPNRLQSFTDWAYVDASGVVQTTNTGARRQYRFFYDGSGRLAGWADALNTSGSCPTGGSHLTCLSYTSGLLSAVSKTQTVTTLSAGTLGTTTRTVTTSVGYAGSRVSAVTDAVGATTMFSPDLADRVVVRRPLTTTILGLVAPADSYARVASEWRHVSAISDIERQTSWNASIPAEPASVTDNHGALLGTPARTVSYAYVAGSLGNVAKVTEPLTSTTNRWTQFAYNANNDVTQETISEDGSTTLRAVTRFCYSADCATSATGAVLLKRIDNYVAGGSQDDDQNVTTEYQYNAYGQPTREIRHNRDASGAVRDDRVTAYTYDGVGNMTSEILNHANGAVTAATYDIDPDPATGARTDLTTTHGYDTAGNRVSSADPRRAILAATGTAAPDDYVTRWTYDALNEQVTERTPTTPGGSANQKTARWAYDELGNERWSEDFGALMTGTEYDRTGRATQTFEDPAGTTGANVTGKMTYDLAGQVTRSYDREQASDAGRGHTRFAYDALGRSTKETEAAESTPNVAMVTVTEYDALDRVTRYVVGEGASASLETAYGYDLGGRETKTDDGFACRKATYDYRDVALTETDGLLGGSCADGGETRVVANTYDALGRLTRSEVTAGADFGDRTVDDTVDSVGNRLSAGVREAGTATSTLFSVNLLDEVLVEQHPDGSTAKTNYDAAGNATDRCFWKPGIAVGDCMRAGTIQWPDRPTQVTTTTFDAQDQRISLSDGATSPMTTTYDATHNYQVRAVYVPTGNGREHQSLYDYDERHRVVSVVHRLCVVSTLHECSSATLTASSAYAYDDNDNVTTVTINNGDGVARTEYYCYDARNQLRARKTGSSCATSPDDTYSYDAAGNRQMAGPTTFAYDAAARLTGCSPSCDTVAHDTAGRIKRYDGWYFKYDADGRLVKSCRSPNCDGERSVFTYDGEGNRSVVKTVSATGAVGTREFEYQAGAVIEERVGGTIVRSYKLAEDGAVLAMTILAGQPGAGTYIVNWNARGDAQNLLRVNADGTLTLANSFSYGSWGYPTVTTHGGMPDLKFRYLYVGRQGVQWDDELGLGLYFMDARHYAPALGRFLQPDPADAETNLFAYAGNNPVTFVDPAGTCLFRWFCGGWGSARGGGFGGYVRPVVSPPNASHARAVHPSHRGLHGSGGRSGRQARLRSYLDDAKSPRYIRGWIRQELNNIRRGKRSTIRVPRGHQLAHWRGHEARKGCTYACSSLQSTNLHKLQHKYDRFGRRRS